jgi:hypothetical protein
MLRVRGFEYGAMGYSYKYPHIAYCNKAESISLSSNKKRAALFPRQLFLKSDRKAIDYSITILIVCDCSLLNKRMKYSPEG